jgi:hypothetical protein
MTPTAEPTSDPLDVAPRSLDRALDAQFLARAGSLVRHRGGAGSDLPSWRSHEGRPVHRPRRLDGTVPARAGSWWPAWVRWLAERSGKRARTLDDAPGHDVLAA